MSSAKVIFVPYLTDNVFRMAEIGSSASMSELRLAVRRAESRAKVGLRSPVPMSALLGDSEIDHLSQLLQSLSADPVQRTAHRLLWFLHWSVNNTQTSSEEPKQAKKTSAQSSLKNVPQAVSELLNNVSLPDKISKVQSEFLQSVFSFLLNRKPVHLENALQKCHELYQISDKYFVDLIVSETKCTTERAQAILRDAQQIATEAVLNFAVDVALEMLSKQKHDQGMKIVTLIVKSPLNDDWKDLALRRISRYAEPLSEKIEEATQDLIECDLDYVDPYEKECQLLLDLSRCLKGRVTQALRWEVVVQDWYDRMVGAKVNRVVATLNARLESLQQSSHKDEIEQLMNLQKIADYLNEAKESLDSIPREGLSAKIKSVIDQRLKELNDFLSSLESEIAKVLQVFALQLAELKTLAAFLRTGNYALRYKAKLRFKNAQKTCIKFLVLYLVFRLVNAFVLLLKN